MSITIQVQGLRSLFTSCADVQLQTHEYGAEPHVEKVVFVFCTGLADPVQINQVVLPQLEQNKSLPLLPVSLGGSRNAVEQEIVTKVFSGELILLFEGTGELFSLNVSKLPQRQTEESTYEVSLKGPRDSFTESVEINVALLRKRVRSTTLCHESFVVGKRSQTKVSLMYLSDVLNEDVLKEARMRLNSIEVDIVNGVSPLEDLLADSPYSLLPLISYNTRPDYVVESLQRGRFCILIDGAPAALIAPINFQYLVKSAEDMYMPYFFVTFERLMRYLAYFIAVMLPGFALSLVSFHTEHLPFPLLATISLNSYGVPTSPSVELFAMLFLFDLFREAGVRLPKPVGSTVTCIGGLIVGDAVIRAGLTSPNIIVIVAVTFMGQFVLINQSYASAVIFMRTYVLLLSTVLGLFGFLIANFSILLYMSTLKSFGMPYLSEIIDPLDVDSIKSVIQFPKPFQRTPPKFLRTKKTHRQGDDSE
ncbi:spore germination protein [Neobacillus sp. NRS-1170]|uniref:spore germination protein n=1 Tax=Neobacillus sp. NRS-1170 TaxID=3233898 RepID=UPI003D2E6F66